MTSREAFARFLKKIRENKNLTQEELAELAGLSDRYVRMLEKNTNQPTLSTLDAFSKALRIKKSDILKIIETLESYPSIELKEFKPEVSSGKVAVLISDLKLEKGAEAVDLSGETVRRKGKNESALYDEYVIPEVTQKLRSEDLALDGDDAYSGVTLHEELSDDKQAS